MAGILRKLNREISSTNTVRLWKSLLTPSFSFKWSLVRLIEMEEHPFCSCIGLKWIFLSGWSNILFNEFEFHRVSKCWVRTCIDFKKLKFFKFKLEFVSSISSFGSSHTSISYFFEFEFIENPNHRDRV